MVEIYESNRKNWKTEPNPVDSIQFDFWV